MTTRTTHCPYCNHEIDVDCHNSINTMISPHLVASVKNNTIFNTVCEECSKEVQLAYDCVYNDVENNFMVYLLHKNDVELLEDSILEIGKDNVKHLTLRYETDTNHFAEKVRLLTDKLNDKAMEIYKLLVYLQVVENEKDKQIVDIIYAGYDDKSKSIEFWLLDNGNKKYHIKSPFKQYLIIEDRFTTYEKSHPQDEEVRFEKIDLEWTQSPYVVEFIQTSRN